MKVLAPVCLFATCIWFGFANARCPNGWTRYSDSCYLFGHEQLDFDDAERFCEHFHGHLVNIETAEENEFLRSILQTLNAPNHWIGLTDEVLEGFWNHYPSEETAEFTDWDDSQPNQKLAANCGAIFASYGYHWVDEPCSDRNFNPICEVTFANARCPDGWTRYSDSCYFFGHEQLDFHGAKVICEHFHGHLVNIESAEENEVLRSILQTLKAPKHWIGLTDEVLDGIWKHYPSEETAEFTDWGSGEPNQQLKANCGAIWESYHYHWVDEPCSNKFNPICEFTDEADESTCVVG